MSTTMLAATISPQDTSLAGAQIVVVALEDKRVKFWYRQSPTPKATAPRWTGGKIPPAFWVGVGVGQRKTAIGTIQGSLLNKLGSDMPVVLKGVHALPLAEADLVQLEDAQTPLGLFTVIEKLLAETPARTVEFDSINQAVEWILDGPMVAAHEGRDLDSWTKSPMEALSALGGLAVTAGEPEEEKADFITLRGGRKFYEFPTPWSANGRQRTNIEFLRDCYDDTVEEGEIVFLDGMSGTGKSVFVEAAFAAEYEKAGVDFYDKAVLVGHPDMTVWDIVGSPWENPFTGKIEFREGKLPFCMKHGIKLFVDEFPRIPDEVGSIFLPTIDGRGFLALPEEYGGTIYAEPGYSLIMGGNLTSEGATIVKAMESRINHMPEYRTNWDVVARVLGPSLDQFVTVLRILDSLRDQGLMYWSPQFREAEQFALAVRKHGGPAALSSLMRKFKVESDREQAEEQIGNVMGLTSIPKFAL